MKGKFLATISGTAMVLVAGVALAGTPLENPPFTNGGFVPPNKDVLKAELGSGGIVTKYTGAVTKCDQNAVKALEKATTAADPVKVTEAEAKHAACVAKANTKFTDAVAKIIAKGKNPACLDTTAINGIKGQLDALLAVNNPIVYCDSTQGVNVATGFNIPANKDVAKGETGVGAAAVKAGSAVAKCFNKSVDGDFKGAVDQTKHNDCVAKASAKGLASIQKLQDKALLPACLPQVAANAIIAIGVGAGGDYTDETFCGSPSGAFIDGAASF